MTNYLEVKNLQTGGRVFIIIIMIILHFIWFAAMMEYVPTVTN